MIERHGLSADAKVILYIDCWKVHKGLPFRTWIAGIPWAILIFVPAGCTGVLQPVDVGIGRVFKHIVRQAAAEYFTAVVQKQLAEGVEPAAIRLDSTIGPLRDASVSWISKAVRHFRSEDQQELCLKAWSNCRVGTQWDLSWSMITSGEARGAYLAKSEEFKTEIETKTSLIPARDPHDSDVSEESDGLDLEDKTSNQPQRPVQHISKRRPKAAPKRSKKRESRRAREARFEDDIETPIEVVQTLAQVQRLQALVHGTSRRRDGTTSQEEHRRMQTVRRAAVEAEEHIEAARRQLPSGYHYGLRDRGATALFYKEDSDSNEESEDGQGSGVSDEEYA